MKKTAIVAVLALSLAAPTFAALVDYQTEVLSDSPYLYYRLGESSGTTAADTSGNSRIGTYVNAPTLGQPGSVAGGDTAVGFDGVDDYVLASNAKGFGQLLDGSSFEFVLKTTTASRLRLFGTYNLNATTGIDIVLNENAVGSALLANAVRLYIRDESGVARGVSFQNESLFDGAYHHLVLTYDSVNGVLGYVDGVAQAMTLGTTAGTMGMPSNFSADFGYDPTLAARNVRGTIGAFFDGTIDEFALYGSALDATQIQDHYAAIPEPATLGLVGIFGAGVLFVRRRFMI